MASLSSIYVKKETLQTLLETVDKRGEKGVSITISLNDKGQGEYNQNVSSWVSQSKEQREAKQNRYFVGNGRTFWSKGETPICEYKAPQQAQTSQSEDLPF